MKAHQLANPDASVKVVAAVYVAQMPPLPKPAGCTEKVEQLSCCNIYITLNMFVKLQKEGRVHSQSSGQHAYMAAVSA